MISHSCFSSVYYFCDQRLLFFGSPVWEMLGSNEKVIGFFFFTNDLASVSLRKRHQKRTSICSHHLIDLHLDFVFSPSTRHGLSKRPRLDLLSLKHSLFSSVPSPSFLFYIIFINTQTCCIISVEPKYPSSYCLISLPLISQPSKI